MENFQIISPNAVDEVFDRIGKEWMLITAKGKNEAGQEVVNTMTASWGGMGILWNRPVAFCFIRPQRYTYQFTEQSERFSLSFLGEQYRDALKLCGTKSGRDLDKFAAAGITPSEADGVPYVKEAELVFLCRKLYADDLKKQCFLLPDLLANYKEDDFHRVYVVEIESVLKKNKE